MRFLVDAQLPIALARDIASQGHLAEHVADLQLAAASDRAIWIAARDARAVLVTKDEDLVTMRALGAPDDPAVIWVRIGNASKKSILGVFRVALADVVAAIARGETIVEIGA